MVADTDASRVESIRWSVRLSDKDPKKLVGIGLAALTAGVAGAVLFQQVLLGFVGFAIILAATAEYWLGATYTVGPKGATKRVGLSLSGIDWEDVKRVLIEGDIIRLSPLATPGRMDPFRGVSLELTANVKEEVLAIVRGNTQTNA
jgi:hypothetical protein